MTSLSWRRRESAVSLWPLLVLPLLLLFSMIGHAESVKKADVKTESTVPEVVKTEHRMTIQD